MVSCYQCEGKLPWGCTCKKPDEWKLASFFSSSRREIELCEEILKGEKPEVIVDGKREAGEAKIIRVPRGCFFEISSPHDGPFKEAILLDKEGRPLYRHTAKKLGIDLSLLKKRDSLKISWKIGGVTE